MTLFFITNPDTPAAEVAPPREALVSYTWRTKEWKPKRKRNVEGSGLGDWGLGFRE